MRIGELARRSGFVVSQICYYERRGLLPPPPRTQSGYRIYGEADAARLRLLRQAKLLGLSLSQVGELLETAENGCCNETGPAVREAVKRRIAEVDRQIAELQALRVTLAGALARGGSQSRASGDSCGGDFCLTSETSEVSASAGRETEAPMTAPARGQGPCSGAAVRLPERELPVLAAGECCQPHCGPDTCG